MSLQIWLPFSYSSGSKNYGLLDGDLTWTTEPSLSQDGKIYNSLSTGGCKMSAEQTAQVLNNDEFSFCCWIYPIAETGTEMPTLSGQNVLFGNSDNTIVGNNRKYTLFLWPTVNDFHWSWMNDDPGENATGSSFNKWAGGIIAGAFPSGEWTHVAVTYKNPNGAIYINGIKVRTFTGVSESSSFAYETTVIRNDENNMRKLCDYRVYSNCLSAKEVKEISKCLVTHNKLSAPGANNLIQNSYDCTNWTIHSDFVQSIDPDDGSTVLSYSRTGSTDNVWNRAYSNQIAKDDVYADGMTVSFDFKCDSIADLNQTCICALQTFNSSGTRLYWYEPQLSLNIQDNKWVHISVYFSSVILSSIKVSGYSASDISYYIVSWQLVRDGSVHFKKMKVEIGNKATPWIPHTSDTLFTDLGFDSSYIDYTGGGYPVGIPNGGSRSISYSFSNDTPRYNACYKFLSATLPGIINGPQFITTGYNYTYTISLWVKYSDIKNITLFTIGNITLKTDDTNFLVNDTACIALSPYNDNNWHLYTLCASNDSTKAPILYIDATPYECQFTGDNKRLSLSISGASSTSIRIPRLVGKMVSDFRLYSTILSASDVKELYSGPISIDKNGSMLASEFEEV